MKLGPVTRLCHGHVKKVDDDIMSTSFEVIVIFLIYSQFEVMRKLDTGSMICKTYIFINSNLLSFKN